MNSHTFKMKMSPTRYVVDISASFDIFGFISIQHHFSL